MANIFEAFKRLAGQLSAIWSAMTPRRRVVLVGSAVLVLSGIWLLQSAMADRAYRPLYTDLTDEEAGVVVARLKELQVPYRLAAGGHTVMVPEPHLAEVRLQLASNGLPQRGRLGFELFDQTSFGATEFAEQINFRRALEGELERSVLSLTELQHARVHISLPKRSVFLDYEQPAKASVIVQLRPGARLQKEQTDAIAYLVASAVEGLAPELVAVLDTAGNVLARPRPKGEDVTGDQLDFRKTVEQSVVNKIVATLEPHLGFENFRASAFVDVDWNAGEQTEEVLDPNAVTMATQKSEELAQPASVLGQPGTGANLPRQPPAPRAGLAGTCRLVETTNYQTSRTVTRMKLERGAIKRMSIAVLVDNKLERPDPAAEWVPVPRSAEEIQTIRGLVAAASGLNEERGDSLTIENLPFGPPQPWADEPLAPEQPWIDLEWIRVHRYELIAAAVGFLILFIFARIWWRRRKIRKAQMLAKKEAELAAAAARKELDDAESEARRLQAEETRMLKELRGPKVESAKAQALKKHLEESIRGNPEGFAQLMRSWVHEDE
jgi:flagellar M-ring protein FliF